MGSNLSNGLRRLSQPRCLHASPASILGNHSQIKTDTKCPDELVMVHSGLLWTPSENTTPPAPLVSRTWASFFDILHLSYRCPSSRLVFASQLALRVTMRRDLFSRLWLAVPGNLVSWCVLNTRVWRIERCPGFLRTPPRDAAVTPRVE